MALSTISPRRGDLYSWELLDPVLEEGELAVEYPPTGIGTGACKFKVGDGHTHYTDLAYAFDGSSAESIDGGSSDTSHTIQLRSDTAYNWETNDPILAVGEPGYDSTNKSIKIGDGTSPWTELDFIKSISDVDPLIDCGFEG